MRLARADDRVAENIPARTRGPQAATISTAWIKSREIKQRKLISQI